jgi:hypothetical protein
VDTKSTSLTRNAQTHHFREFLSIFTSAKMNLEALPRSDVFFPLEVRFLPVPPVADLGKSFLLFMLEKLAFPDAQLTFSHSREHTGIVNFREENIKKTASESFRNRSTFASSDCKLAMNLTNRVAVADSFQTRERPA